jgi:hypothetical protein
VAIHLDDPVLRGHINKGLDALTEEFAGVFSQPLPALAQVERKIAEEVPEVLFVCVQNAGRSQMAARRPRIKSTRVSSKPCASSASTSPRSFRSR